MAQNFYELLGASRNADEKDLKRAFRSKAREVHPDRNDDPDAVEQFKQIKKAYDVLSDPARREQYDRVLALQEAGVLARMMEEARFRMVPFVPMEPVEPPRPAPPRPVVPYPTVPSDAYQHPDVKGWWVPMPPTGATGFMPNPYYDPSLSTRRGSADAKRVLMELLDLVTRRRW